MADDHLLGRVAEIARKVPLSTVAAIATRLMEPIGGFGGLASAPVVNDLEQIAQEWSNTGRSKSELAWALRAAAVQDEWWRDRQGLRLVWTGPSKMLGTLRRTEQALLEVIDAAQLRLWLVSFAGYGVKNIREALRRAVARGVDVRFVIESPEESEGRVTFSALEGIDPRLAEIAEVLVWPREKRASNADGKHGSLHVKCALADEDKLFISSANLTDLAMTVNMELGLLVDGGAEPSRLARHFEWLESEGILVPLTR